MDKILVTGACGYIGSHTILALIEAGYDVVCVDNLVNSDRSAIEVIRNYKGVSLPFYEVDLCDRSAVKYIFENEKNITGIIHFAALKAVGESVKQPLRYYHNNLNSVLNVIQNVLDYDVKCLIFSSSCTVYGEANDLPVTEQSPWKKASSPYGHTKQIGEQMIDDALRDSSVSNIALRYFNPAGAHHTGLMGESPVSPPQNLVPIITETAIGKRPIMQVFGSDYDTRDGSCIRDYIHIEDLADAHVLALKKGLEEQGIQEKVNLGIGEGVTVFEAIKAFEKVTGKSLNYSVGARRAGDVEAIYADASYAEKLLGWKPKYTIEDIMKTAWEWEKIRTGTQ